MTVVLERPPSKALNRKERRALRRQQVAVQQGERNPLSELVAAAVNVRVTANYQHVRWGGTDWQQEAWMHYDTTPEFHQGVNIGAHNMSRARLIGVDVDAQTGEPGTQPTADPDVVDIMAQLFNGPSGQGQALAQMYRHLEVAGDGWVLATDNPDLDGQGWEILATTEVTASGGGRIMVQQIDGIPRPLDEENELLIRIWQPHPKRRWEADCPARALLPVLRELAALQAMVNATVKSRLASAGILWIPDEITMPRAVDEPADVTQVKSDSTGAAGWLDLLTEAMTAPIKDPDSAAAVVPMIVQAKSEYIEKVLHMEFGRDLDAMIEPLRESGIKRLAVGMNLPPEILLGLGDVNHWTAWAITEDYAKAYIAPKLELICDALTTFYLRPALRVRGRDPEAFAIYFDLDKLVPKQISVENADKAWGAGLLAEVEYMAALGFSRGQMANNDERARRLITELLARGNPQTLAEVAASIAMLFPGITIQPLTPSGGLGTAIEGAPGASASEPTPTATGAPPTQTPPPVSLPPQATGS